MQLAKALKKNPRELAQAIAQEVMGNPLREGLIANVEIAGPGFMNVRLVAGSKQAIVTRVLREGERY
jgi:arginyl-tRNA synthetase